MSKLTEAEKILELHLGSEFYRFKQSEWYFNIKNAMNEAINYTRGCKSDIELLLSSCNWCNGNNQAKIDGISNITDIG
jgi:hypothetical protein